ncbi:hypothetical protein BBBOND_0204310 [Babesia bigemina]|uniref:6-Cys domain-containing protein n=1 Tax=Babesia bigemina TaxID=5866 RepID=A0A061D3Y0_BABBI|nr:hypothetical protein BBBOND_0204310 [Babesia bigemina]CDR95273.1 hypothetical protein BBBOND_0204310 [Babesia bigemina]|eukprot:XP_012767459.1 hypothetical protein BBBOND_0204310 [Babesia bigemina]
MQSCGVTYPSDELFKPETPKLYYADGGPQFGREIVLMIAAPYVLDPPNCFDQVSVNGELKDLSEMSKSLIASASDHFVILKFNSELIGPYETLRYMPPLECRCVTKVVVLSAIQIENYYSK